MEHLTDRQAEVLQTIERLTSANGYAPTFAELCDELGIGINAINDHLLALEKKGRVSWVPRKARTLRVLQP